MAVKKFVGSNTTSWSNFVNWLNENKAGTFLEGCTITIGDSTKDISNYGSSDCAVKGNYFNITNDTNGDGFEAYTVSNQAYPYQRGDFAYARLYKNSGANIVTFAGVYNNNGQYNASQYFNSAILCNNGLMLKMYVPCYFSAGGITYVYVYVALTHNSDGRFVFIGIPKILNKTANTTSDVNCGCSMRSTTSGSAVQTSVVTTLEAWKTSIAPVGLQEDSDSITIDSFYQAITSQCSMGLAHVMFGSDEYITNGMWYIKD